MNYGAGIMTRAFGGDCRDMAKDLGINHKCCVVYSEDNTRSHVIETPRTKKYYYVCCDMEHELRRKHVLFSFIEKPRAKP
jgi:CRISPR/Cas system CSM-associated protein Csm5 (group 7 of RAMP superfamily)